MDVSGAGESLVATGGADGAVVLWHDATAESHAETAANAADAAAKAQTLSNALQVLQRSHASGYRRLQES